MIGVKEIARRSHPVYPFIVGIFLGILQTGLFFQLTFALSSGFGTYLLITLCWLIGGFIGATLIADTRLSLLSLLIISMIGYGLCSIIPILFPFDTSLWWLYAVVIVGIGMFPGVFFARAAGRYKAGQLFLWENNGFIMGLMLGTILFLVLGRPLLWAAPLLLMVVVGVYSQGAEKEISAP